MKRVRGVYGIRTSLGKSRLDSQIQFGGGTSLSVAKKPITIATFMYFFLFVFSYAYFATNTVIKYGGFVGWLLFTIGYAGLYFCFLTRTKTLNYRISYLPVIYNYWRRGGRKVPTNLLDSGDRLKNMLGIDPDKGVELDGMVHFTNGEVGYFLDVVGNASSMIFDNDQEVVIKDARTIYKNLPSMVGLTLITQASTQDVHLQIQSKLDQLHNLAIKDPGLEQVVKRQGLVLRDRVGSKFSMIRQYILVRGKAEHVETVVKTLLASAASSTNNYLKSAELLTNEDLRKGHDGMPLNEPHQVEELLTSIFNDYQGR